MHKVKVFAALTTLAVNLPAIGQVMVFVNVGCGDDSWTGLSAVCAAPNGPKKTIKAAIGAASSGSTVSVAPGTYTGASNAAIYFGKDDLFVVGASGAAVTIVDGQGFGNWSLEDTGGNVIDGFTFRNCFDGFGGGAIFAHHTNSSTVRNCRFEGNSSSGDGGAILCWVSATVVDNCVFVANEAAGLGGALFAFGGLYKVTNSTFIDNVAPGGGNSAYSVQSATNCVFRGPSPVAFSNVTYSNVEGGYAGIGNINADPQFVDSANGDYRLLPGSPCIDGGNNSVVPASVVTDIDGLPRFKEDYGTPNTGVGASPIVDMGAHEFQGQTGCYADCDGSGTLDFFDYLCFQNEFTAGAPSADCDESGSHDFFDFLCWQNAFAAGCQ